MKHAKRMVVLSEEEYIKLKNADVSAKNNNNNSSSVKTTGQKRRKTVVKGQDKSARVSDKKHVKSRKSNGAGVVAVERLSEWTGSRPMDIDLALWERGGAPRFKAVRRHRCAPHSVTPRRRAVRRAHRSSPGGSTNGSSSST